MPPNPKELQFPKSRNPKLAQNHLVIETGWSIAGPSPEAQLRTWVSPMYKNARNYIPDSLGLLVGPRTGPPLLGR